MAGQEVITFECLCAFRFNSRSTCIFVTLHECTNARTVSEGTHMVILHVVFQKTIS